MRKARIAAAVLITFTAFAAEAQNPTAPKARAFNVGHTDIGPTLGLGGIGAASFAIGGRFERGIRALPDMGDGVLGIGVSADWYNYNDTFTGADYDFTYIPIAATANYHIKIENNSKFDPFVGLGLGYLIVDTPYSGSYNSGIYFVGRVGARYFMTPKMALYGDAGAGAATLNVGVTFKLSG
ncbi:MAG: outer membrane beta-barrel protein [Gemmatimonadaceae bacterium]